MSAGSNRPSPFRQLIRPLLLATSWLMGEVQAVPQIVNFQGRVQVGGVNFDGSGAFKFALVDEAGTTTYWSNDGTSVGGAKPTSTVTLPANQGLYYVLLGDVTLPNMTAIPSGVFANDAVFLRVWFNDGTHGSQLLTPDQRIAAVGYAMMADSVRMVPSPQRRSRTARLRRQS